MEDRIVEAMFSLTLSHNPKRDQVELNARNIFSCAVDTRFCALSYDVVAVNLQKVHVRMFWFFDVVIRGTEASI
jgi:hypothetical protein